MRGHRLVCCAGIAVCLFLPACQQKESGEKKVEKAAKVAAPKPPPPAPAAPTEAPPPPTATAEPAPEPTPPPAPKAQAPAPAEEHEAEVASELQLLGVVQANTASPSALIGYQDKQDVFRKGEDVFGQGTLKEVRADSVAIQGSGGVIKLKLVREAPPVEEAPPKPEVVEAATAPEPAPPPVSAALPRGEAKAGFRDLASHLEKAGAHAAPEGGKGIQLDTVAPASFLAKLGLRSGDLLQKINGVALSDPAKLPDLSGAADGAEVSVTVTRGEVGFSYSRKLE